MFALSGDFEICTLGKITRGHPLQVTVTEVLKQKAWQGCPHVRAWGEGNLCAKLASTW